MPNGVAFTTPPMTMMPDIRRSIEDACATLRSGERGAVVGVVTNAGMNAAVVRQV
jgi:hypothetical protein